MSLADAFDLLAKNKSVGDDVFRNIFADSTTRYPAVREAIAAFLHASTTARIMDKPVLVVRYVRALAILVEYEQHVQHLSVPDWACLVQFLCLAYTKLSIVPRDRAFVKNVYDMFRALSLLLEARESIDANCFDLILDACEDFCGEGPLRETSCHQYIMVCVRVLTQLRFARAQLLGNRLIQIGRPRQERLKREMFAFACLVPQAKEDLIAIGPAIIEPQEVEFTPAVDLDLPWFRPSVEADLSKYIAAKALATSAPISPQRADSDSPLSQEPPRKRVKTGLEELDIMALAFSSRTADIHDLITGQSRSFWLFVVLGQAVSSMTRAQLLEVWQMASSHIQSADTASSACFCLAQIVPRLVAPDSIDDGVLARLRALLLTMSESSYPALCSGSTLLWHALSRVRVLDQDFQYQKTTRLDAWLTKSLLSPPMSLLTSFFARDSDVYHVDSHGLQLLKGLQLSRRVSKVLSELDPNALTGIGDPYDHEDYRMAKPVQVLQLETHDLRSVLWRLAILAHSGQPVTDFKHQASITAVSDADIRSIIWFANIASARHWAREYFDAALALVDRVKGELLSLDYDAKAAVDLAMALLEEPDSTLNAFVAGHPEALRHEDAVMAVRSLQPLFQSYALQRSPFVISNVLRLLNESRYAAVPEYSQLLRYFMGFISAQSPYSRLRPHLARLLTTRKDIVDLIATSSLENAFVALPMSIRSDILALELLRSIPVEGRKAVGFVLILRGASPAQVVAFLYTEELLLHSDLTEVAKLLHVTPVQSLVAGIATPLLFGAYAESLKPLIIFAGGSPMLRHVDRPASYFLGSPHSLSEGQAMAVVEDTMRDCSYLGSVDEKVECVSRCWLLVRACGPVVSAQLLRSYVKGAAALAESMSDEERKFLEPVMRQLLNDQGTVEAYPTMAADVACMGFPVLARMICSVFEATNSNMMRILRAFESSEAGIARMPGLLYELLRASGTSYESWSLVVRCLTIAAHGDLDGLVDTFHRSLKIKELVGALQLWTRRLKLNGNTSWMNLIGYLASEVGDVAPKPHFLGSRSTESFVSAMSTIYDGLSWTKKWHLHPFMRQLRGTLAFPQPADPTYEPTSTFVPRYPQKGLAPTVNNTAIELADLALAALNLPLLGRYVFEEVPELVDDFLPLLAAAGLTADHSAVIEGLLRHPHDERVIALRVLQRYYEATKSFMDIEVSIIDACQQSGPEFAELGIACVEALWGAKREPLSTIMKSRLVNFHRMLQDDDFESTVIESEDDGMGLSHLRMGSSWRELDFNLISFEATGDSTKLQESLQQTGLWSLAFQAAKAQRFYNYEQAWWMQQWDLPCALDRDRRGSHAAPKAEMYEALFNHFSGHTDEATTLAALARIDFSAPRVFGLMLGDMRSVHNVEKDPELPLIRRGRELIAVSQGSPLKLSLELRDFSARMRALGEVNDSAKYALKLERLADRTDDSSVKLMSIVESAHTAWSLGDQSLALSMLQKVLTSPVYSNMLATSVSVKQLEGDYTLAKVYSRLGTWAKLAKHESDETIFDRYFTKAEECANGTDMEQVFHYFAHFCDEAIHEPLLKEEWGALKRMLWRREREIDHLKAALSERKDDRDLQRRVTQAENTLISENQDFDSLAKRRTRLIRKCAESYLKSLRAGDTYAEDMSYFIALWFEFSMHDTMNYLINDIFEDGVTLESVSIKLLPWMNQLTSRLAPSWASSLERPLRMVVTHCLERHPYHTLWQLINLSWSATPSDDDSKRRNAVSKEIMDTVRKRNSSSRLIRNLTACATQMQALAEIPVRRRAKALSFSALSSDKSRWWRQEFVKMALPVPTSSIAPQRDGDYSRVPTVVRVGGDMAIAGGLSSPKILTFFDSAGTTSRMVLKHSNDDLRQDAIMQQVFGISNGLLATVKGGRLRVRTYNVIPLGLKGGAIEFVKGTRSLQDVVEPLHKKYGGRNEYTATQARDVMREVQRADRSKRISAFEGVMDHTPPQMRRFWPERMPDIHKWLAAKTAWSRSTAVMSIVGYVVGLGDRHCSNLLVDTVSGEVVHIDLGIAFDQAKLLSVPETVPFRLTRDIVDGMGACGVDGPFTMAARTTLSILREQQSRIMTVLEVLKHDALYSWRLPTLSGKQVEVSGKQVEVSRPAEKAETALPEVAAAEAATTTGQAEAALRGVRQKLSSTLNVEATVRDLVARARDPANLALIYLGWNPFY